MEFRWLVLARLGSAVLLAVLALAMGQTFARPDWFRFAAGAAAVVGGVTWWGKGRRPVAAVLFLADIGWISLAVVAAGNLAVGLTLLFPLVALGAGVLVGGWLSALLSLGSALALLGTVGVVAPPQVTAGRFITQALLVLLLGLVSDRMRSHLLSQERALDFASRAIERMRLDTDNIVRNLTRGVLSVDDTGRVMHVNRVAETTLGIRAEDVKGRPVTQALPHRHRALAALLTQGLATARPVRRMEIEVVQEGRTIPLGVGTTILFGPDGELTGAVALFQDLTEVREKENRMRRQDRLAAVGELAAGIAHEIRNSVLPISGSVQILSEELQLNEDQAKLFEVIERETENVERFVDALLSFTKARRGRPERMDLRAVVEEIAQDVRLTRREGPSVSVTGEPAWAWADSGQIRQAIRNLVLNAADAAGEGGNVVLRTGTEESGNPWVEVEDDGPGIRPEDRDRVLEPFYTSKPGGTGLGLAIVSRIVEAHDGRMQILDSGLGGNRVRLTLQQPREETVSKRTAA